MKLRSFPHRISARSGSFKATLLVAWVAAASASSLAQQLEPAETVPPLSSEVESCKTNLNRLFEAIQEYQKVNQTWPNDLSDLHPDFFLDLNHFICPRVLHNGGVRAGKSGMRKEVFEDPVPTTYTYEFKPKVYPLWAGQASTEREFKLLQMKVLGSNVPIVRCIEHRPSLFLSVGGDIFETTGTDWESLFQDSVDLQELYPDRIFQDRAPLPGRFTNGISPRDPSADPNLVDLSRHYTSAMHKPWRFRNPPNVDLSELPQGVVALPGMPVAFDLRGVIQLSGTNMVSPFPKRVDGIALERKGRFLHFLEGAILSERHNLPEVTPGTELGRYEVHYADGQHLPIPIRYGMDVFEWNYRETPTAHGARVAWEGKNRVTKEKNRLLRLYHQPWENPRPDMAIKSINFVSNMAGPGPFLIAVTLEP